MIHDVKHYTYSSVNCPQCGAKVDGWRSIPNPKKLYYQKEGYLCLRCGYRYFRHEKVLTPAVLAKLEGSLGDIPDTVQCPRCRKKMNCYSGKLPNPSRSRSFKEQVDCICSGCSSWHTKSITQLTLEELNQRRTAEKLPPLSHLSNGVE